MKVKAIPMNKPLSRQENEVLEILQGCGSSGMNSYTWRTRYVQLPARIFGLKKAGYQITTRRKRNGSVDYILIPGHVHEKNAPASNVAPQKMRWVTDREGNAWQEPVEPEPLEEPRQEAMW
jgi:hypothetical protein